MIVVIIAGPRRERMRNTRLAPRSPTMELRIGEGDDIRMMQAHCVAFTKVATYNQGQR